MAKTTKKDNGSTALFMQGYEQALADLGMQASKGTRGVRAKKAEKSSFIVRVKARKKANHTMADAIRAKKASVADVRAFLRTKQKSGTEASWRVFATSFGYDV